LRNIRGKVFHFLIFILIAIFYLSGGPTLPVSALLQGIRGEGPQLHALRLASAAISARSSSRLENRFSAMVSGDPSMAEAILKI
jgi:hypothetical protein